MQSADFEVSTPQGIPVTNPVRDVASAHRSLYEMSSSYPNEMFTVGETPDGNLVVAWIPGWSLNEWIKQAVSGNLHVYSPMDWPGNP